MTGDPEIITTFWKGTDSEVMAILTADPLQSKTVQEEPGWTLLHIAAFVDHNEIVPQIISFGADVNARDALSFTPLHNAIHEGRIELAKLLLQGGADPNIKTSEGFTPLEGVSFGRHENCYDMIVLLCDYGAHFDFLPTDDRGETLLHWAAQANRTDVVSILLKARFPVDCRTKQGRTPLFYAVNRNAMNAVEVLLQAGANPDHRDNRGESPIDRASAQHPSSLRLAQLLAEYRR